MQRGTVRGGQFKARVSCRIGVLLLLKLMLLSNKTNKPRSDGDSLLCACMHVRVCMCANMCLCVCVLYDRAAVKQ